MPTAEELFKREFFLHLVDTASATLREWFSNMQAFFDLYGFLYSSEILRSTIQRGKLEECCRKMEGAIDDVNAGDLKMELEEAARSFPPHATSPPNVSIALRHLLTLPVTVASGERSFSTLERLKTYMRSTMDPRQVVCPCNHFNWAWGPTITRYGCSHKQACWGQSTKTQICLSRNSYLFIRREIKNNKTGKKQQEDGDSKARHSWTFQRERERAREAEEEVLKQRGRRRERRTGHSRDKKRGNNFAVHFNTSPAG